MKRFALMFLSLIMLASCGVPTETTGDSATDAPSVTEKTVIENDIGNEPSKIASVVPFTDGIYKIEFEKDIVYGSGGVD